MKDVRRCVILTIAAFASACATPPIPEEFVPASKEQTAYLIGTLGVQTEGDDRSPNGSYELLFRAIGGSKSGKLTFRQIDFDHTPVVYRAPGSKHGTFVIALRPGDYEFHNVYFTYNVFLANAHIKARQDFSLPFTLKAGRALYLGELTARTFWDRSNPLNHVAAAGFFTRSNTLDRDRALLEKTHPEISGVPVDRLAPELAAPPFVLVGK